jgi:2-desacetyl-2-hydroxyethyl bacteriochlorophyllide A dehydrogenase
MRRIVLTQPGSFAEQEAPEPPEIASREALVRMRRVGVCGSDFHAFAGRHPFFSYPRVIGHELAAEIVQIAANDRGLRPGDHCAIEPYLNCGQCRTCRLDRPNCCENLRTLGINIDGGMQPFLAVPIQQLHKSERLSLDQLALIETLGIGAHAVERSMLRQGEEALVVGAGPIGLTVTQFAQAAGADVRVLEVNPARREFVGRLGVKTLSAAAGYRAEVVFDATGNAQAMEASFDCVAPGGRLVFVGLIQSRISFDDWSLHRRELTVLASRNSCHDFPRIIHMIEEGKIDTSPWITHRMKLLEVPVQFADLPKRPNLVKCIVEVDE